MTRFLSVVVCLSISTLAWATPEHVRISWCGGDTARTLCITWNDSIHGAGSVAFGSTPTFGQSVEATVVQAPAPLHFIYEAELMDLTPDSPVFFQVTSGGGTSASSSFQTASLDPCAPFKFAVLGDNRSQDSSGADIKWNSILGEAVAHGPSFVLNTGDLVKDGDEVHQWKDYLEKTDPLQAKVPILPSIGNHDDDKVQGEGALYNLIHQLPRNHETFTEDFYYVIYGDAIFVSLTTQNYKDNAFQMQADWLDQVLTEHPKRWKFVFFHHPVYSSNKKVLGLWEVNHPPNEQGQNGAFVPVFDKHHVDIVFSGHNHYYERFVPMKGGGGSDQGVLANGYDTGTAYFITGGAGAFTFDEFDLFGLEIDLSKEVCGDASGSEVCDGRHHYLMVEISGNTLTLEAIATSAQNFDTNASNIAVFDSITITKTDPIECGAPTPVPEPNPEPIPEPGADTSSTPDPGTDGGPTPTPDPTPTSDPGTNPGSDPAPVIDSGTSAPPVPAVPGKSGGCATHSEGSGPNAVVWIVLAALLALGRRRLRVGCLRPVQSSCSVRVKASLPQFNSPASKRTLSIPLQ
jgi:MYXO-CTERM domain-containing protein